MPLNAQDTANPLTWRWLQKIVLVAVFLKVGLRLQVPGLQNLNYISF